MQKEPFSANLQNQGDSKRKITTVEMVLAMVGTLTEVLTTIPDGSVEAAKLRLVICD